MLEPVGKESPGAKRLVLGFDAGCFTCSDLARRIKERVGDKVEIKSLRNPQVAEWRKKSLGEDAPWAPTLIEVNGPMVRAWTGWQLGINLSRFLGPVATWRVMQALGEVGAVPAADGLSARAVAAGLTRGQFLKGVGGAALALSVLTGSGALFPSAAKAADNGSLSERLKAKRIAENSQQYERLDEELERATDNVAANLDIDSDNIRFVNGRRGSRFAVVGAGAEYGKFGKRGVGATFFVSMRQEKVLSYNDMVILPGRKKKGGYNTEFRVDGQLRGRASVPGKRPRSVAAREAQGEEPTQRTASDCIGACYDDCLDSGFAQAVCDEAVNVATMVAPELVKAPFADQIADLFGLYLDNSGGCMNYERVGCYEDCACSCFPGDPSYGCDE